MSFWDGFYKKAESLKRVACVGIFHDGKMLFGKRRDNGKWTNPGGHLEEGEKPVDGAVREVFEEAGIKLDPKDLTPVKTKVVTKPDGTRLKVFTYRATLKDRLATSMKKDPDQEVERWSWIDPVRKLPDNLHVPLKDNVLLRGLGL